ncbi:hypothetical protein J1N35_009772 [Gossypium stocksii]|uniref:Transposase MuDR plant domain-containing protein n=1 Tax=Gossypium stocksii TaxID=47602 RepID=A0A9D4AB74_9ROSI|nr:hypothetical protein J1N35_009772 [Gossypium stocksii]
MMIYKVVMVRKTSFGADTYVSRSFLEKENENAPYRRLRWSSSINFGGLEVRMEFSSKHALVAAMKQYSIKHGVNFHVTKSQPEKHEAKCAMLGTRCPWKIMASVRWKSEF